MQQAEQQGIDYAGLVADAPPAWVFKQDRRSRVWQVDGPSGPLVIKRFQHSPLRQMVAKWFGKHPGQREVARAQELRAAGLPVVEILAHGTQRRGLGVAFWLVTPYVGKSVQAMGKQGDLEHPKRRKVVLDAIAGVTAELILRGYYHRDHKTSNLLIDERGKMWMIDVGAVRLAKKGRPQTLRMLAMLNKTLALDQVSSSERRYCFNLIRQKCDFLGAIDELMAGIEGVKLPRG